MMYLLFSAAVGCSCSTLLVCTSSNTTELNSSTSVLHSPSVSHHLLASVGRAHQVNSPTSTLFDGLLVNRECVLSTQKCYRSLQIDAHGSVKCSTFICSSGIVAEGMQSAHARATEGQRCSISFSGLPLVNTHCMFTAVRGVQSITLGDRKGDSQAQCFGRWSQSRRQWLHPWQTAHAPCCLQAGHARALWCGRRRRASPAPPCLRLLHRCSGPGRWLSLWGLRRCPSQGRTLHHRTCLTVGSAFCPNNPEESRLHTSAELDASPSLHSAMDRLCMVDVC